MNELSIFLGELLRMSMVYIFVQTDNFHRNLLNLIGNYFQRDNNSSEERNNGIAKIEKDIY